MNKYELCFQAWSGDHGRRKHHLTYYFREGFRTDSQTDKRLSNKRSVDWFDRCDELKPPRRCGGWEPKSGKLI